MKNFNFETFKGKKAIVTGSSTGIGREIAISLANMGVHVGIHYNTNKNNAESVVEECHKLSGSATLYQGDLLIPQTRNTLIKEFISEHGTVDILINNAGGIYDYLHFSELSEESFNKTFALNTLGPFCLIRDTFHYMKNKNGCKIVNISTTSARYGGSAYNLHYSASKAALDSLTKGFAREGSKYNILVNSIHCGIIKTSMQDKIPLYDEQRFKERVDLVPLKRAGTTNDIASMALFLSSDCSDYITGQIFTVSGGE